MATVKFLYRSTKDNAPLTVRLLFKDYVQGAKTQLSIYSNDELTENPFLSAKAYFNKFYKESKARLKPNQILKGIHLDNKKIEIETEIANIKRHVLNSFNVANETDIINNKDWLKECINTYYNPREIKEKPKDLISFIDYYLDNKIGAGREATKKKYKVVQNKMIRFESYRKKQILIKDVNEDFKKEFENYYLLNQYSENTIQREFVMVKTFCFYAKYCGLEVSHQLEELNFKREKIEHIYLTDEDLEAIKKVNLPHDYLNNARKWLLLSCYLGQRVSDFMRFTKDMIRIEDGKHLLEFTQVKTDKIMTIPVPRAAREILNKNKGEFPRRISDQKYNDYIKEVCGLAGLNKLCKGKKRICIAPEKKKPTKNDYRDVAGEFEKWELVSSHIGRRTFATLHYGKVPTSYLIAVTGHSTEIQFLNYLQKSEKDKAKDAYKYFD